jgi:Aldo/keto reductase family
VHPIAALQTEYSLWSRNPEIAVLQACRELGVSFVAFSPVARGFLCGPMDVNAFDAKDIRRTMPRFSPENYAKNQALLPAYNAIAAEVGCTPSQLAIAWLLHQGEDILPIPGTTRVEHLMDDLGAADLKLSAEVIARLNALINQHTVHGDRYNAQANSAVVAFDDQAFGRAHHVEVADGVELGFVHVLPVATGPWFGLHVELQHAQEPLAVQSLGRLGGFVPQRAFDRADGFHALARGGERLQRCRRPRHCAERV